MKVLCLHPGYYFQVHQENEPRNRINRDRTVKEIVLVPQYNLQGDILGILLTGKLLRRSHWTPVNVNEDVIERYNSFGTKVCPDELILGDFNDQPIPSDYYNSLNDGNDDGNNIPGTTAVIVCTENKGVEDSFVKNHEGIDDEIKIDNNDRLASDINPPQNEILYIEGVDNGLQLIPSTKKFGKIKW